MHNSFRITDDRFTKERTDLYDLIFEIQFSRFRFIVCSGDSVIWFEDHFLGLENDVEATLEKTSEIIKNHDFLSVKDWKTIRVISDFQLHIIIPAGNFKGNNINEYIQVAFPSIKLSDFELFSEKIDAQIIVYALMKKVNELFTKMYPQLIVSFTTPTVIGLTHFCKNDPANATCVVSDVFFDLYHRNGKSKLITVERLPLKELHRLPSNKKSLNIYGEITPYSTVYKYLEEKFESIEIGSLQKAGQFSPKFVDIACHRYFTLISSLEQRYPYEEGSDRITFAEKTN